MSDEPSGPLTFNLGLVNVDEKQCSLTVDIRYPATKKGSDVTAALKEQVESCGVEFVLLSDAEPLYLPKESQLVTLLSGAYKDVTGEECDIFSMGGGTYARQMFGKGVAFGASFKDQADSRAHQANEFLDLRRFKLPRGDLPGGHVPDAHRGVSHGTVYPRDPGGHLPQRRGAGLHPTGQRQPGSYCYTEHGFAHAKKSSDTAREILRPWAIPSGTASWPPLPGICTTLATPSTGWTTPTAAR